MCTSELSAIDGRLPLHSSHLRPSTNTIRLHRRPRVHETIRGMKKPKNESDVKLRPDWFTSEATSLRIFVGRAGSTIGNLPRFAREKSLRTLFYPFLFLQRSHSQQTPPFQTSSRAPELQHLWGYLRVYSWCTAKKLCIAKMSTHKCFQENTILYYY